MPTSRRFNLSRNYAVWAAFLICFIIVLVAMSWISVTAVRLDWAQERARLKAQTAEEVRLAQWRIDSVVAPMIARESTLPYFFYRSFYPYNRAYPRMFEEWRDEDELVPSPLLARPSSRIYVHFQFDPEGNLTSPQIPDESVAELARKVNPTPLHPEVAHVRLRSFGESVTREKILEELKKSGYQPAYTYRPPEKNPDPLQAVDPRRHSHVDRLRSMIDEDSEKIARHGLENEEQYQVVDTGSDEPLPLGEPTMTPLWINDMLILARRVTVNGKDYVQGCWLNWPEIRTWLLAEIKDLLPNADLHPGYLEPTPGTSKLTTLPVELDPGVDPAAPIHGSYALHLILGIAWLGVVVAVTAVVTMLFSLKSLSDRRGAFVSAVTHELRTPITSLRMYTEMLAGGMVRGDEKQQEYLDTMYAEADRLGHLVENVLAYSRLERGRARGRIEAVTLGDLVNRVKHRLMRRAEHHGIKVELEVDDRREWQKVRADMTAVEQILFNLVDNACKYANTGDGARIRLEATQEGNWAVLRVRDFGPGISHDDADRLFRPFTKSARDAAHSAPGVGLGLALSRRLAHMMGGELKLDPNNQTGACFVLTLPVT